MIDKLIAIDVETSGLDFGPDPTRNHQIVSIGLIVADNNFNEIDSTYIEIKWNETSWWSNKAEQIHGLSKEYLNEYGITEENAVIKICEFIFKHFDPNEKILMLGHNARNFDIPFLNKLLNKFDLSLNIHHRCVDSFSIGYVVFGAEDSNELFDIFAPKRTQHNALEDARLSLLSCRNVKKMINKMLNNN